ncbi:superinfection immunity protein [Alteromonas sp. ASW11-19]|uniref:Superinfection immunity protein n=1 Tax=Alteromonas salexigens TaxID=2982530 RepID=A0ABT2VS08_9ALTE|nr:superinfection immunity protein [Alteromonas salexigens]MCU7555915.1 superinfection immunity protein [Alteromonas salexigens]
MTEFLAQFQDVTGIQLALVSVLVLVVWFLPVGLALLFNRKQAKLIAIACVPAGLSVFAWSAVLVWAVTGKAAEKYLPKKIAAKLS